MSTFDWMASAIVALIGAVITLAYIAYTQHQDAERAQADAAWHEEIADLKSEHIQYLDSEVEDVTRRYWLAREESACFQTDLAEARYHIDQLLAQADQAAESIGAWIQHASLMEAHRATAINMVAELLHEDYADISDYLFATVKPDFEYLGSYDSDEAPF